MIHVRTSDAKLGYMLKEGTQCLKVVCTTGATVSLTVVGQEDVCITRDVATILGVLLLMSLSLFTRTSMVTAIDAFSNLS